MKTNQNIENEKEWHEQKFYIDNGHWTSKPLFASRERHWLKNDFQKIRFFGDLFHYLKNKSYFQKAKILMAPVGNGDDLKYLHGFYEEDIHGIDISEYALKKCPSTIIKKARDILNSGYENASFDLIICCQFLHHTHKIGFEPFIQEFYRILRPGGVLAIMEPSEFYPLSFIFRFLNKWLGNVTGKVNDEKPIQPSKITKILKSNNFENIQVHGLSYNHVRFPIIIQNLINLIDFLFRRLYPFNMAAESVGWYGQKHSDDK